MLQTANTAGLINEEEIDAAKKQIFQQQPGLGGLQLAAAALQVLLIACLPSQINFTRHAHFKYETETSPTTTPTTHRRISSPLPSM